MKQLAPFSVAQLVLRERNYVALWQINDVAHGASLLYKVCLVKGCVRMRYES